MSICACTFASLGKGQNPWLQSLIKFVTSFCDRRWASNNWCKRSKCSFTMTLGFHCIGGVIGDGSADGELDAWIDEILLFGCHTSVNFKEIVDCWGWHLGTHCNVVTSVNFEEIVYCWGWNLGTHCNVVLDCLDFDVIGVKAEWHVVLGEDFGVGFGSQKWVLPL